MRSNYTKGFTALELLISISVIVVIAGIVLGPFNDFRESKILDTTVDEVISLLEEARGNTLASKDAYQYGVHLETSKVVLFMGATFSDSDPNNKERLLHSAVELSDISIVGGPDVLFARLTGKTSNTGTTTVSLKNNPSRNIVITIEQTGLVGF